MEIKEPIIALVKSKKTKTINIKEIRERLKLEYTPQNEKILKNEIEKLVQERYIEPQKTSKTNIEGISEKYKIIKQEDVDVKQEIINLSNKLKIDYYLKNTKEYQKDKEIINSISKFISESIEGVLTINERSYQIFKNEKLLKEREDIIKKLGLTLQDLKCYETYEPFFYYENKEFSKGKILIIENKDTFWTIQNAVKTIASAVNENTVVMSLMNGVDSEEIISEEIGKKNVIRSLIKIASHKENNGYCFNPETTLGIIFGETEEPYYSERVKAIEELFSNTGLHYRYTDYILEEMWAKFRLNVCNNLPQAILGAGVGCYEDSIHMKAISDGLRNELETIAKAKGIDINKSGELSKRGSAVPASARYSTLQDLDAKRHTEIDMFSGALIRMGKELNIKTPYNEFTYHMIKALEEKNDGKFDYTGDKDKVTWAK